jgi:hypothetical protein
MRGVCRRLAVAPLILALSGGLAWDARAAGTPGTGTTTSPVPVTLPLRAAIVSRSTTGPVLTLTIACRHGSVSDVCSGPIMLTASGGQVVGSDSYSAATGTQTTVTIALNPTGQTLLSASYKLPAMLTIAGTTALTRAVKFHYAEIVSSIVFTWVFTRSATTAQQLTVTQIPAGGMVEVQCQGGGCPFGSKAFSPSGGKVPLAPSFKGSHLRPNTTLELEITDTNRVGKVATFRIESGAQPTLVEQCLPPGATSPSRCA